MTKAYRRGDLVTIIADWDGCGTVSHREAVVYSCGQLQMVLTCETTGEELGRNFPPVRGEIGNTGTFPRMTHSEAEAACKAAAENIIENQKQRLRAMLDLDPSYSDYVRSQLELLHEPRAAHISELKQELELRLQEEKQHA